MAFSCSALLAVWTCPVFLSPLEPLTLQVGDEAFHWHRMSEVERQVATLSGQCHRHDEKLGQLVALLQKLQARVDRADSSSEGGVTPGEECGAGAASQGGWCWWAPGLHSDTRGFSGTGRRWTLRWGAAGRAVGPWPAVAGAVVLLPLPRRSPI